MRTVITLATLLLLPSLVLADPVRPVCSGRLDVVKFKDSSFEMVGDVVAEDDASITIIPANGGRVTLRRELIGDILYNERDPRQVTTKELVDGFTHCVSRVVGSETEFRIVRLTPQRIFLNIGSFEGLRPGIELNVFRAGEALTDPDTGDVIGREKNLVGIVQVIGVGKQYAEAVPVNQSWRDFREGDVGMFLKKSPVLAVAGITTLDGQDSPYGALLSEQLIGKFNQYPGLKVVERRQLGQVLRELAIQNAILSPELPPELPSEARREQIKLESLDIGETSPPLIIDEGMAEKMRMLRGADAIVVGTVADMNGNGAVNLRMVDTSTAAVIFSTHQMVGNPEKPIYAGGKSEEERDIFRGEREAEVAEAGSGGADRSRSERLDLLDKVLRAIYQR